MTVHRLANMAYQLGQDGALLHELADGGFVNDDGDVEPPADVLELVECRTRANDPLDVAALLGPGWKVAQNTRSAAKAGSVVAVRRRGPVRLRWSRLQRASRASRRGAGVQDRYRRVARLRDAAGPYRVAVQHDPLRSTGRQDDATRSARAWVRRVRSVAARRRVIGTRRGRWKFAGDTNRPHAQARRDLNAPNSAGADVMTLVWSAGWGPVDVTTAHLKGSDHAVLTFTTRSNR